MRDNVWKRQKKAKIEPNSATRTRSPEKPHTNREKASKKDLKTDAGSGSKRRGKNARRQFFEEARNQTRPKIEVFRANPRNPSGKKKEFPSCYIPTSAPRVFAAPMFRISCRSSEIATGPKKAGRPTNAAKISVSGPQRGEGKHKPRSNKAQQ